MESKLQEIENYRKMYLEMFSKLKHQDELKYEIDKIVSDDKTRYILNRGTNTEVEFSSKNYNLSSEKIDTFFVIIKLIVTLKIDKMEAGYLLQVFFPLYVLEEPSKIEIAIPTDVEYRILTLLHGKYFGMLIEMLKESKQTT